MLFLPRFNYTLAVAVLLALSAAWMPGGLEPAIVLTLLLAGAVLVDVLFIPRDALHVTRRVPPIVQQSQRFAVTLQLSNPNPRPASFEVLDSFPTAFAGGRRPLTLKLGAHAGTERAYHLRSFHRGRFAFGAIHYRVTGPLGLIQRQGRVDQPEAIAVLPDLAGEEAHDLELALAGARLGGRRRARWRGEGREFESLRPHRRDDDFRHIDWKASAKRGNLVVRQYETERDQRLVIVIDAGRLMRPRIGAYRKLDYAVNAAVHLAQAARHKGDLIGHAIFDDELRVFAEPRRGDLNVLVRDLTVVQPSRHESDYANVFHQLQRRLSRRALIVCFTDLGDPSAAEALLRAALPLRPKHLPVLVAISNSEVLDAVRAVPGSEFEVFRHVAAGEVWNDYERTLRAWRSRGVPTVSVPARKLSAATVNEYLRIKESALL